MAIRLKPLREQTIVITGASSGMGLATARQAAKAGARVVLVARNRPALEGIRDEIVAAGGQAVVAVADVADRQAVKAVVATAVDAFGSFDTWVNNAGVGILARAEDVDEAAARRLYDTNLWGVVNGSLEAVAHLRAKGGALINFGSVVSDFPLALQAIYSSSKHAVKGFIEALRAELAHDCAPVSVTLIKPGAVGTPMIDQIQNLTSLEPVFPPPVYNPNEGARAVLAAAQRPIASIAIGGSSALASAVMRLSPRLGSRLAGPIGWAQQSELPAQPRRHNLNEAVIGGHEHGLARQRPGRISVWTRLSILPPMLKATVAVAGFAAVAAVIGQAAARPATLNHRIEARGVRR